MKIAVLFDGAGLARLGLERAGHECVGFELDPAKHHLGQYVGSGNTVLADATTVDLSRFEAVWASPPCQWLSSARTQGDPISSYAVNYLDWSLNLMKEWSNLKALWVENIVSQKGENNNWGTQYNAAQFLNTPVQNRNRTIGGSYIQPVLFRPYKRAYEGLCPAITATEYKGCATDHRRASRFYGRKLTLEEAAYHQGFQIPLQWYQQPEWFERKGKNDKKGRKTRVAWLENLYEAVGNGVPVYMAEAFGRAYSTADTEALAS